MKDLLIKISLFFFLFPLTVHAQIDLEQALKNDSGKPININSDTMSIKNAENLAIFTTNVIVTQGGMELRTDQLKVYSEYDEKTKKSKFKLMEAEGSVYFTSEDKTVQSNKAVYDVIKGVLTLEGNVSMKDSETSLAGKLFVYNVKTGRSEIRNTGTSASASKPASQGSTSAKSSEGAEAGGRVRAIFVPGEGIKNITTPMDSLQGIRNPGNEDKTIKEQRPVVPPPPPGY